MNPQNIRSSPFIEFISTHIVMAWFWFAVRIYVGSVWFEAGFEKVRDQSWTGVNSGKALSGFIQGSLSKTGGAHPDVQSWYAMFLENVILPHTALWSHVVAYGELLVGIGLILGVFTATAAFFGSFMNLNYLLAGTVSTNPILLMLSIGLIFAWKISGYIGLDRYIFPFVGTPWQPGKLFRK